MSYTLHHGDCLEIMPTLPDRSIDAVICDPPYGTTACKWDSVIPFEPMWRELKRLINPRGAIVLFGSQPFTSALVMSNPRWFKYQWVWEKSRATGFQMARKRPMKNHEDILVFGNKEPLFNQDLTPLKQPIPSWRKNGKGGNLLREVKTAPQRHQTETGFAKSIIKYGSVHNLASHPTQKPLTLLEYLVKTYTNEGDAVLDFTMGSGTTGHACANTGRRFIGIERDAGYFAVAQSRIAGAYAMSEAPV